MVGAEIKMNDHLRFIWICPICGNRSNKRATSHSRARRYGRAHIRIQHGQEGRDIDIIIKKIDLVAKENGETMEKSISIPKGQLWFEVVGVPSFTIQPKDILRIPHHIFVSERVYNKICKQEV
jgi:hypothetical protein